MEFWAQIPYINKSGYDPFLYDYQPECVHDKISVFSIPYATPILIPESIPRHHQLCIHREKPYLQRYLFKTLRGPQMVQVFHLQREIRKVDFLFLWVVLP